MYKVYFPKSRAVRDIYTVTFFPKVISFPKFNTDDLLRQVAEDSTSILTVTPTLITPSLEAGDLTRNSLLSIATILKRAVILPVVLPTSSQDDTEISRGETPKEPSLHPAPTPTQNIQIKPPRVVIPTQTPTPAPIHVSTYNIVIDKCKKSVQSSP